MNSFNWFYFAGFNINIHTENGFNFKAREETLNFQLKILCSKKLKPKYQSAVPPPHSNHYFSSSLHISNGWITESNTNCLKLAWLWYIASKKKKILEALDSWSIASFWSTFKHFQVHPVLQNKKLTANFHSSVKIHCILL